MARASGSDSTRSSLSLIKIKSSLFHLVNQDSVPNYSAYIRVSFATSTDESLYNGRNKIKKYTLFIREKFKKHFGTTFQEKAMYTDESEHRNPNDCSGIITLDNKPDSLKSR